MMNDTYELRTVRADLVITCDTTTAGFSDRFKATVQCIKLDATAAECEAFAKAYVGLTTNSYVLSQKVTYENVTRIPDSNEEVA